MKPQFKNKDLEKDLNSIMQESVISVLASKENETFVLEIENKKYTYKNFKHRNQDFKTLIQLT